MTENAAEVLHLNDLEQRVLSLGGGDEMTSNVSLAEPTYLQKPVMWKIVKE